MNNESSSPVCIKTERLAWLIALITITDRDQGDRAPKRSPEELAALLSRLEKSWKVRTMIAHQQMVSDFEYKSLRLTKSTFLAPIEDTFQRQLDFVTAAVKRPKQVSFRFDRSLTAYADVSTAGDRRFTVTFHLGLIVRVFLGAIALVDEANGCAASLADAFKANCGKHLERIRAEQQPLLQALNYSAFDEFLPQDEGRRLLAYTIATKCLEFAVLHEAGHLMRGHLDYARLKTNIISEDNLEMPKAEAFTWQLLESQSDDYATLFLSAKWRYLTEKHNFSAYPLMCGQYGFFFSSAEDVFTAIGYSYCLLFFVLDQAASSNDTENNDIANPNPHAKYPPLCYRLWRALKLGQIFERAGVPWDQLVSKVQRSLQGAEFPGADANFLSPQIEEKLLQYDELLKTHGQDLLLHEKRWAVDQFDLRQRPPDVNSLWGWKLPRK